MWTLTHLIIYENFTCYRQYRQHELQHYKNGYGQEESTYKARNLMNLQGHPTIEA